MSDKIKSTMPEFVRLEKALNKAKQEIGWKDLTAFIEIWCSQNQPCDTAYSLQFWIREHKRKETE